MPCLHFRWPLEYQGDFPPREKVLCICNAEFVHFVFLQNVVNFHMNKIWDVMLVPY